MSGSRGRRNVALAAALAAVIAAIWWSFAHEARSGEPAHRRDAGSARPSDGSLPISTASLADAPAPEAAYVTGAPSDATARSTVAAIGVARLLVRVTEEGSGEPVHDASVYLDHTSIPEEVMSRFFQYEPKRTDEHGEIALDVPAGPRLKVHVRGSGAHVPRVVDVDPLAGEELRELAVALFGGGELEFHGLVVQAVSLAPIASARIEAPIGWSPREQQVDVGGRFLVRGSAWGGELLVTSPGYARAQVKAANEHESPDHAAVVELHPRASLVIQLQASEDRWRGFELLASIDPDEVERRARLRLDAYFSRVEAIQSGRSISLDEWKGLQSRVQTIEASGALPLADLVEFPPESRESSAPIDIGEASAKPDALGRVEWTDLPARVPLGIALLESGRVVRASASPVVLATGESKSLVWNLGEELRLVGRVVDQHGQPVAACEVGLWSPRIRERAERRSVTAPPWDGFRPFLSRTDDDGRFEFAEVQPGRWLLAAGAVDVDRPGHASESKGSFWGPGDPELERWLRHRNDPAWHARQVMGHRLSIEIVREAAPSDVELRVQRGVTISGRVTGAGGLGVEASVFAAHVDDGSESAYHWASSTSADDGTFIVGPLLAGRYRVSASASGLKAEIEVEAGATNVAIEF